MTTKNQHPASALGHNCTSTPSTLGPLRTWWRTVLTLVLLLTSSYAMAARVCYDAATQTIPGVSVTTTGSGCGVFGYQTGVGTTTKSVLYLKSGLTIGATAECSLSFSPAVKNVTIDIGAHTCVTDGCEKVGFEVNGAHRPILSTELSTASTFDNTYYGILGALSLEGSTGDVMGGNGPDSTVGNGVGRVALSETSVRSLKLTETTIVNPDNPFADPSTDVDPQGTLYQICYDGLAVSAPTVKISKVSTGGTGSFSFKGTANANGFSTDGTYTVTTTAAGTAATGAAVSLSATNTVTEIQEVVPAGWVLTSASCVDNNAATTGNPSGSFGQLNGTTLQIPASVVMGGADLQCTFNNTYTGQGISGKVILDTGAGSGVAHDAIQNGSEKGHSGIPVSLTNCTGTTYSTTTSAGDGSFSLSLLGVPADQAVCIVQTLPSGYSAVSASAGTATGATASTTSLKFTPAANTAYSGIVLGNAPVSTLTSDGAQQTTSGQTVTYAHIYTAGSAGSVVFTTSSTSTPANQPWSSTLYLDANCSGTLGTGDRPLTAAITVTAGQQVCVLNRVFTPQGIPSGSQDTTVLTATETWNTATLSPASQSHALKNTDISTISSVGLNLIKEVRKLSSCPASASASLAITTAYAASGSVKPGDALEYRVRYNNNTSAPINSVKLFDAVPAYTQFVSAYCLGTPTQGISGCAVTQQPGLNATSGSVAWALSDVAGPYGGLQPSDGGAVGFCITVQTGQ